MQEFFARGPNPKWPPTPFFEKLTFEPEQLESKFKYIFSTISTTRILILTSFCCWNIILTKISKMATDAILNYV